MPERDQHASTEQLADLLAGVLPDAEAGSVAAHVSECVECGAGRDRLAALPDLLAAVPAPALPADVAARLDAAIEAESDRRAGNTQTVVVPLRKVRRDRVRHWFAGAATAAAVLVAISVGADVAGIGIGAGNGDAASGDNAIAGDTQRQTPSEPESSGLENSPDSGAQAGSDGVDALEGFGRLRLPEVAADDFAADVELLYDSGAFRAQRKITQDLEPAPGAADADAFGTLVRDDACGDRALRRSARAGAVGPFVLVDREVSRLVADGPAASRTVQAFSCADGALVTSAVVDLTR